MKALKKFDCCQMSPTIVFTVGLVWIVSQALMCNVKVHGEGVLQTILPEYPNPSSPSCT